MAELQFSALILDSSSISMSCSSALQIMQTEQSDDGRVEQLFQERKKEFSQFVVESTMLILGFQYACTS